MTKNGKRKICFPILNRIHFARQRVLLGLLNSHPEIELQLVLGGSVLLEKYGEQFLPAIKAAGFSVAEALYNVIDGGNHVTMAKTAGLTVLEFTNALYKLEPDIVLLRGDRFEQLAVAMAAAYLNKTIAHIEGGDVSGTIDESVRHAITKLAHIHFVTHEEAGKRVIQMGENPALVFNVGSPDVEFAAAVKKRLRGQFINSIGTGHVLDWGEPYIIVMFHPVTTEDSNRSHTAALLEAVDSLKIQAVWFWPNSDAGTNEIAKAIRMYREARKLRNNRIRFITDILPDDFIALLKGSLCLVGNSSAGIKECSYLGTPVVNIGSRQNGRLRGPNVIDVSHDKAQIIRVIKQQITHGPYPSSLLYYKPKTSENMVEILRKAPLLTQKRFFEIKTS